MNIKQHILLKITLACLALLITFPHSADAQQSTGKRTFYPLTEMPELKGNSGFALFFIDSEIDAASFKVTPISTKNIAPRSRDWKTIYKRQSYTVSLKGLAKGFYVLPMDKGVYQIMHVNAPYFDLPYKYDTSDDVRWQFNVDKKHLNYIGHLNFNKERSTSAISVGLHNRIAMDHVHLEKALKAIADVPPLRMGVGVKDDFFQLLIKGGK